jgi:hypothetical protein
MSKWATLVRVVQSGRLRRTLVEKYWHPVERWVWTLPWTRNARVRRFLGERTLGYVHGEGNESDINRPGSEVWTWRGRIQRVVDCPENARIPRVEGAGTVHGDTLRMHQGIELVAFSYGAYGVEKMLVENRGVHEPQEEFLFQELLRHLPRGATMVELGSYWAYYSMWFHREIADARNICIEPEAQNLRFGQRNFSRLGWPAEFAQAFIGCDTGWDLPEIFKRFNLENLDLLHSDIQGYELPLLEGGRELLAAGRVHNVFVATHGDDLHSQSLTILRDTGMTIVAENPPTTAWAYDGLILATRNPDIPQFELSRFDWPH